MQNKMDMCLMVQYPVYIKAKRLFCFEIAIFCDMMKMVYFMDMLPTIFFIELEE